VFRPFGAFRQGLQFLVSHQRKKVLVDVELRLLLLARPGHVEEHLACPDGIGVAFGAPAPRAIAFPLRTRKL
jgi:hypothetical protein